LVILFNLMADKNVIYGAVPVDDLIIEAHVRQRFRATCDAYDLH